MEPQSVPSKLLRAQIHVLNHIYSFINSMSLKCAIELDIPDIMHKYGQPMPLSKLITSLSIHPSKIHCIHHLMQILTHSGFFSQSQHNVTENEIEVRYELTDASELLLKESPFRMSSLLQMVTDPICIKPWFQFSPTWFRNEDPSPFHTQYGMTPWELCGLEPKLNHLFNDGMAGNTQLISNVMIEKCKGVFEGLESLVDVGGGTGTMAKVIVESFPQLKYIVFDLPHVVADLHETENIKYVGGDMFEAIPSADSIILKCVLHNWNDEECLKILNKCKEAITCKGKVIIIDMVMENEKEDNKIIETQLLVDMQMMVLLNGKERNEKEWAKLIFLAGFSNYKIVLVLGLFSIIELYP